jgi:mono/diheme cytochrome c family protein
MARAVALLVLLGALVLAAGCGGSDETTPTPETVVGDVPTGEEEGGGDGGDVEGDPAAGKDVFASAGCGSCHTLSDDDSSVDYAAAVDQITNGGGGMQAYSGTLSEEEIANVAAYVVTARGR